MRSVGCARFDCNQDDGGKGNDGGKGKGKEGDAYGWMVVCEYYPPGNVETEYAAQVQRQIKGGKGKNGNEATCRNGGGILATMGMVLFTAGLTASLEDLLWW